MREQIYLLFVGSLLCVGVLGCSPDGSSVGEKKAVVEDKSAKHIWRMPAESELNWGGVSPIFIFDSAAKDCLKIDGIPLSLWGNGRGVRVKQIVSSDGEVLVMNGLYDDGTEASFIFYRSAGRCRRDIGVNFLQDALEILHREGGLGVEYATIKPRDQQPSSSESQWYAHDVNNTDCLLTSSPAKKIRDIQSIGRQPRVNDLASGAVEIEEDVGDGRTDVWTFYRSLGSCETSLPRRQKIDKKYE